MSRKNEIQVGIVFIVSMAILILGVMWFKEFTVGGNYHDIVVEFQNTSGLQKGDPVEVAGVSSGSVKEIHYQEGRARVTIQLESDIEVAPGTRVIIENVGIMGQKMVAIYPGQVSREDLPEGVDFMGQYQVGLGGLMGDTALALGAVNRLAASLEEFLAALDQGDRKGTFTRILTNTDMLTAQLATLMGDGDGSLQESLKAFNQTMSVIHTTLDTNSQEITETLKTTSTAMAHADTVMTALESTLLHMDRLLGDMEAGRGTMGKMLQDEAVYDEMKATLEETRLLIEEIKANPRKFFKFSVF